MNGENGNRQSSQMAMHYRPKSSTLALFLSKWNLEESKIALSFFLLEKAHQPTKQKSSMSELFVFWRGRLWLLHAHSPNGMTNLKWIFGIPMKHHKVHHWRLDIDKQLCHPSSWNVPTPKKTWRNSTVKQKPGMQKQLIEGLAIDRLIVGSRLVNRLND